jgi:hypothetical protein
MVNFPRVKLNAGFLPHYFQQFVLGDQMGGPDFFWRKAQRATEAVVVFAPRGNVAIENFSERGRGPGAGVNTIGNCFDGYAGKHLARGLAVLLGDAVDIFAETQREIRHV